MALKFAAKRDCPDPDQLVNIVLHSLREETNVGELQTAKRSIPLIENSAPGQKTKNENTATTRKSVPLIESTVIGKNKYCDSKWFSYSELDELVELADPGDLLEIDHGLYKHWAVFAGQIVSPDGEKEAFVIHVNNIWSSSSSGFAALLKGKRLVECDRLRDAVQRSKIRINNQWDVLDGLDAVESNDVLNERIQNFLKEHGSYNIFDRNCEHFAKYCRYGVKESSQIDVLITYVFLMGRTILAKLKRVPRIPFREIGKEERSCVLESARVGFRNENSVKKHERDDMVQTRRPALQ